MCAQYPTVLGGCVEGVEVRECRKRVGRQGGACGIKGTRYGTSGLAHRLDGRWAPSGSRPWGPRDVVPRAQLISIHAQPRLMTVLTVLELPMAPDNHPADPPRRLAALLCAWTESALQPAARSVSRHALALTRPKLRCLTACRFLAFLLLFCHGRPLLRELSQTDN